MGRRGEAWVASHLRSQGFQIVGQNVRVGRLELDVVATRGSLLVVVEVRTRTSRRFGSPVDTLDHQKINRVRRAAAAYAATLDPRPREVRLDAAAVTLSPTGPPELEYFEAAL